jgi:hypothetical protein
MTPPEGVTLSSAKYFKEYKYVFEFSDGTESIVDFKPIISYGNSLRPFLDASEFKKMNVDKTGTDIYWGEDWDMCFQISTYYNETEILPSKFNKEKYRDFMNDNPFEVLLNEYKSESESLCYLLEKKIGIDADRMHPRKNDAMRSAFAFICMDYLEVVADVYPNEDFTLFCDGVGFGFDKLYYHYLLGAEHITWEIEHEEYDDPDTFISIMESLILHYRNWWGEQLKSKMSNQELIKLFSDTIFEGDPPSGDMDMFEKVNRFFDDL